MNEFKDLDDSLFVTRYKPGHFYSPLPSFSDISEKEERLFRNKPRSLPGLDLNQDEQIDLLRHFNAHYLPSLPPYDMKPVEGLRFYHDNFFYSRTDAVLLHCMIRHLKPARIIEIGSGFSSCITLDTNQLFFDNKIGLTFVEPYPDRLYSNLMDGDKNCVHILEKKLETVGLDLFETLLPNDILFIDSTHVSKIGSDVNYLLFEVLPSLNKGVFIHFHDIFYPFEYLEDWVKEGRAWNEAYILRAFLQYNSVFKIRLFTSYMLCFYPELFQFDVWKKVPPGGSRSSLWLSKT